MLVICDMTFNDICLVVFQDERSQVLTTTGLVIAVSVFLNFYFIPMLNSKKGNTVSKIIFTTGQTI